MFCQSHPQNKAFPNLHSKAPLSPAFSESYSCGAAPDDGLSAVEKLEKYAASENIFNR